LKIKSILYSLCIFGLLVGLISAPQASQAATTAGSISGTVTYYGSHETNHEVFVAAHLVFNEDPVASVHIDGPGIYSLADVPDGSYYISAFLDIYDRGGGPPDMGEPIGWYDANGDGNPDQVAISGGNIPGIDILMEDITDEYIQGTACYLGGAEGPGPIEIGLHTNVGEEPVTYQYLSDRPCADYIFSGVPPDTYYISMFYDLNGSSGPPEPGEPIAYYDGDGDGNPDPISYTGNVITDIDITIGKIRHYVDFSADGKDNGTSWEDAYLDLQDAIAAAGAGEEIWVGAGLYTPGTTRNASFELQHGVAVYGGFNGTEDYRHQRNPRANITVLSGEIGTLGIKTDNSYHVVTAVSTVANTIDETTILDGFTITGGYADGYDPYQDQGGGFINREGYPTLVNLNFIGNYATNHGGAIVTLYNIEPLSVVNSTFSGNSTTSNAGGIANLSGSVIVANSSFTGNLGGNGGGIVGLFSSAHTEVYNSILWGNQGNEIALQNGATVSVTYSIIDGGYAEGSNILACDPLFVDADGLDNVYGTLDDDLHLQGTSPAIDAGDNDKLLTDVADSNGNDDTNETTPMDFGGESRLSDDLSTPNTGNGTTPVDMGADEYAAPAAIAGLSAAASKITLLDEPAIFAARVISGTQIAYSWDFGDGSTSLGGAVSHEYTLPGVYQVVLTATNSLGSQQASTKVTISEEMVTAPGTSDTTTDGALTIEIPEAITSTVTFTYTPQTEPTQDLSNFQLAGVSFQLQAADADGIPIIEPEPPFTLTVQYDESSLPSGMNELQLKLYRYDTASGNWVALTVVSREILNDTITVLLDHFSEFALLGENYKVYLPIVVR